MEGEEEEEEEGTGGEKGEDEAELTCQIHIRLVEHHVPEILLPVTQIHGVNRHTKVSLST